MQNKNKLFNSKKLIITLVAVIALAAIMQFTGLASFGSYAKVLFFENKGESNWGAHYYMLTGKLSKILHLGDEECYLDINVKTDAGNISLLIKGTDGTTYFHKENIQTSSYRVTATGAVRATVIAEGHRGSFSIEKHNAKSTNP